jgi:predicted AlkP superfamily pyrophosphatase or phosphodiesterase
MVDVSPTMARLLHFADFHAPDGHVMPGVASAGSPVPRLMLVVVWDGGGRDVLGLWPDAWPHLKRIIPDGVWFDRATVGSSPSVTPPSHADLGTGAYPMHHGMLDLYQRMGGVVIKAIRRGPAELLKPTLADVYDAANGNRPKVGLVASMGEHMGMIGHGSWRKGGDRDVAVLSQRDLHSDQSANWALPALFQRYFRFPTYVTKLPAISTYFPYADALDGTQDGRWRGHSFSSLVDGWDTPARIPYETRVIERVISHEGFGSDSIPDLLLTNYQLIDEIGHKFFSNDVEMRDALVAQDAGLPNLIRFLNSRVGTGKWVMLITADHGHQQDPRKSGGFSINELRLKQQLGAKFGSEAVQKIRPTQIFVDPAQLRVAGHTLREMSNYLLSYTKGDSDPAAPSDQRGQMVFAAALPSWMLGQLPCLPEARGRPDFR